MENVIFCAVYIFSFHIFHLLTFLQVAHTVHIAHITYDIACIRKLALATP